MNAKRDKKESILQAGGELMFQRGYNGTGVKDIVDAAGIPKGSFYSYFPSKEEFAIEALRHTADNDYARIKRLLSDPGMPPLMRLEKLFAAMVAENTQVHKFSKGCFVGNMSQEMADRSEPIRTEVERLLKRNQGAVKECLREAQGAGQLAPKEDIATLAEFIWNSWEGALLRMKASKNPTPLIAFQKMLSTHLLNSQ